MKAYGHLFVALLLSAVAMHDGVATPIQGKKNEGQPGASGTAKNRHATQGRAPKNGAQPGALGKIGGQPPAGGKGTSGINGTGIGPSRSSSINGMGMGAQH